jgi:hypothetical protein
MPTFRDRIELPPDRTSVLADELSLPVNGPVTLEVLRDHPYIGDEGDAWNVGIASEPKKTLLHCLRRWKGAHVC